MKITVEHAGVTENEVILRCPDLDEEMLGVLSLLRSGLQRLCVWDDSRQTTLLSPGEVVYCETVDDRVFVYTGQAVYQFYLWGVDTKYRMGLYFSAAVFFKGLVNVLLGSWTAEILLEWALAAMWYALKLRKKLDTAALNRGLRRFQNEAE